MNEIKNNNLYIRVSDKEKKRIEAIANKSGLSVSEYLRQRAFKRSCRRISINLSVNWMCSVIPIFQKKRKTNFLNY